MSGPPNLFPVTDRLVARELRGRQKKSRLQEPALKMVLAFPGGARYQNQRDDLLCLFHRRALRAYEALFRVSFVALRIGHRESIMRPQNAIQRLPGDAQSGRRMTLVSVGFHQRRAHLVH